MAPTLEYVLDAYNYAQKNEVNFNPNEFCLCFLFRNPGMRIAADTISWEIQSVLYEKNATKEEDPQDKQWDGPVPFVHDFDHRLFKPAYKSLPSSVKSAIKQADYDENFTALFFVLELPQPNKRYHMLFKPKTVNLSFGKFQQNGVRVELDLSDSRTRKRLVQYAEGRGWVDDRMEELGAVSAEFEKPKAAPKSKPAKKSALKPKAKAKKSPSKKRKK